MSVTHDESRLRFVFDNDWTVVKWDDHEAHRQGLCKMEGTKAVDFLGLWMGEPCFIEVKNFCDYRIDNKRRLRSGALATEIAAKVRNTLASLIWACDRAGLDQTGLRDFVRPLVNRSTKVPIVLWLEEDRPSAMANSALAERIKHEISWINPRVIVTSRAFATVRPIQGLEVTAAP